MWDFNTPLTEKEKLGCLALYLESKLDLSFFINSLALLDIDLMGGVYSWSNKRIRSECIYVRLDRALISPNWLKSFSCRLSLLPRVGSDHSPISLSVVSLEPKRNYPFRFEKMWISHPDLLNRISNWWSMEGEGTAMFRVTKKLSNMKWMIKIWNKMDFGHIFQEKEEISDKLSSIHDLIQHDGYNEHNRNIEMSILTNFHNIISKEENLWKQRSRIN